MEWEPQYTSSPSNPSSLPSQSTSNSGTRSEKIPTFKQVSPSPAVSALSKLTDDELRRKGVDDLVRILRRVEADYKSLLGEHGNIVKDVNRRLQIFVLETRSLKEFNQKLQDDNQELRDLCCFLDDDRQRARKLAREWQRFGRYTASVMRSEVAVYQEKLRELDDKQNELITENMELKELCLFLDQERVRITGDRDEGDGSSNGTVTGHEDGIVPMEMVGSAAPNSNMPMANSYPISPSSAASYIRELELKVHFLEEEKKLLAQRADRNSADGLDIPSSLLGNTSAGFSHVATTDNEQVLQVHEELEKTPTEDDSLDDPEKAIVREMCNVVWRTLGDTGDIGSFNESSDSIQEPPYVPDSSDKSNVTPGTELPYGQSHAYGYTSAQPQFQISSTPIPAGNKQSNVGTQFLPSTSENFSGPASYQLLSQRQISSRPSQESVQQPSTQLLHSQSQNDTGSRGKQNSVSERLAADRSRNFPYKQPTDDRRNPEQKHLSHFVPNTVSKPSQQQLPLQQPLPSSHQQQHSLPDVGGSHYALQRPTDLTARSAHQPSHFQQSLPSSAPHQSLSDMSANSHPSQRPIDLTARSVDQLQHYQQRPSPPQHPSSSSLSGNQKQRPVDSQANKLQSGHIHSQQSELPSAVNLVGNQSQNQRITQGYPHQQVKLLDAPGTGRHVQRPTPPQGQVHSRDWPREESTLHGQAMLHSKGDNAYEERNSAERDTQPRTAPRSASSSSSVPNLPNSQISSQNPASVKSMQNFKGPSVFRAYPPQLSSMPNQPVSLRGSQGQEFSSSGNPHQQDPTIRGNYPSGNQPQKSNVTGKRFQEQEWRQTYLDDSDTL